MTDVVLLHIADSSYPTGSFAHSGGLEYAVRAGWVHDETSLLHWVIDALGHTVRPLDGKACAEAWHLAAAMDLDELACLNERLAAFRSSSTARAAQAQMGRSLLEATAAAYASGPVAELRAFVPEPGYEDQETWIQFAVAWGASCNWLGIGQRECTDAFLFGVARQWALAAVRTIPIGQKAANRVLAAAAVAVARFDGLRSDEGLRSFAPALEIASMGQGSLTARYFRS